ncbi:EAL domain-containing protein [Bacillus sp. S13(2024)]|uniref:sensor domain-containing protein n=1 Tax=unclassified Bacillus (in: firmicutes) TaxID=185979 RepID=UPI003D21C0E0
MKELCKNKKSIVSFLQGIDMNLIHQGLLHAIQDLVFIVKVVENKWFQYIYVNEKGLQYANLDESCYGRTFQELLPSDVAHLLQVQYEDVLQKKKASTFRDYVTLHTGEISHYESSLNPICSADGTCQYIICITRNITTQIQEKAEIQEKKMLFKSLLEYNDDAIVSLDLTGKIMYANPATYTIFGYRDDELKNQSIFQYIADEDINKFQNMFQDALQGHSSQVSAKKSDHKNGYELYVSFKTVPIIINGQITGVYFIARNITKQILNERKTEHLAYYDQLTGLLNRISCTEMLAHLLRRKKNFALILIDLDQFHLINDIFGYETGDEVLKKVARRLKSLLPKEAYLFREHGNQFVVVKEHTDKECVEKFVRMLLKGMEKRFVIKEEEVYINASIGIVMSPTDGEDEKILLKCADVALVHAKEQGKGNYSFYHCGLNAQREKQFMMENQLHQALERNEFTVYYQPQINIVTEEMVGMEALLRWNNKELGNVSPEEFIPLAEKTGFILKIDEWVLHEVCRQIREWLDKGITPVPIAVNISAKHFRSFKLIEAVTNALTTYRIPSHLLTIEITEGALMHKELSEKVLIRLKEKQLEIHLDDFGTGYSSLSYLKQYPIDTLKIDRSFMQEVGADEKGTNITTAIIDLAHTLGLNVIAEGVEEAEQIQFLKEKNAILAQGYYFNKPLSINDIERFYFKTDKK